MASNAMPDLHGEAPDTGRDVQTILGDAITESSEKIENGRIRDPEKERIRLEYHRTLLDSVREYRKLLATESEVGKNAR